ncbi:MAG: cupin domain-containing protein [Nitrososphaerales archaeon]|nr:cupin domain-containing protein [Nitrososphaerales archaeon]
MVGGCVPKGKAVNLRDLIGYQDGSIVSRTIIVRETGNVTLFAFDSGQGLSEHSVPFDALVYLVDGEGEFVIGGKLLRLNEGEMVVMPANIPHVVRSKKRFKMLLVMIRS